jgi:hypothetical protein
MINRTLPFRIFDKAEIFFVISKANQSNVSKSEQIRLPNPAKL